MLMTSIQTQLRIQVIFEMDLLYCEVSIQQVVMDGSWFTTLRQPMMQKYFGFKVGTTHRFTV